MTNSPWVIVSDSAYERSARKFFRKHPELIDQYEKVIAKMQIDPHERSLQPHPLHGVLKGKFGVSITDSYRITITIAIKGREVHLLGIGDHSEAYE